MVYILRVSFNAQLVIFWFLTPLTYEIYLYYHFTQAHFISSIGLVLGALYACTGAGISSLKPWPREIKSQEKAKPEENEDLKEIDDA